MSEDMEQQRGLGTIVKWFESRAFGFIRPDSGGPDLFVHLSALADGEPTPGLRVRFTRVPATKGPKAIDVEPAGAETVTTAEKAGSGKDE
jgi:CspA family cold shock protein